MRHTIRYFLLFPGLILFLFTSCKIFGPKNLESDVTLIFPAPPDTARIQYLTSISSSLDISKKQSAFSKFIIGEKQAKTIVKPYGIHMRYGKIYICDIGIKGIEIIDLEKGTFDYFLPSGKGQLKIPVNCYVDSKGNLFIADTGRKQIVIFDNEGNYLGYFGDPENFLPIDIFVSDNKIYVSDLHSHKINVYKNDTTYQLLNSFPDVMPKEEGYLYQAKNIYITNDKIFVSDFGGFMVNIFSTDGTFIESVGSHGRNPGQFERPKGLAVDHEENLYVIDAAFGNAQLFNKENKLLMFFGGPYNGKGYMYLPADIFIDYDNINYFEKYVDPEYNLKYIILVTNQYGSDKLNIYGRIELKNK